jgi:basic amino acid/polyamine antiporter, APA family
MNNRKMGLMTIVCLCIGTIIGAGIFGSMPSAAKYAGPTLALICVIAAAEMLIRYIPAMISSSAIPASNGFYMYLTRLVNPYLGYVQILQSLFNIIILATLAQLFAQYTNALVKCNSMAVAIGVLTIFGVLAFFGVQTSALVNNFMVIILFVGMGCFVIFGMPEVKTEYFTLSRVFTFSHMSFADFGAALGLIGSCLTGGYVSTYYAEEMRNPEKNVFRAFVVSTLVVAVLYVFLSIVTVGVTSLDNITSLADLAKMFMPRPVFLFFLLGGALTALATTINGAILEGMVNLSIIARDQVLPDIFNRENKYHVSVASLLLIVGGAIIIVVFNLPISTLLSISTVIVIVIAVAQFIPPFVLQKKYPHCYHHSPLKIPNPCLYTIIAVNSVLCLYEIYSLIITTAGNAWIVFAAVVIIGYGYLLARKAYLKTKGIDLLAIMSKPYQPWEEMEKEFEKLDRGAE